MSKPKRPSLCAVLLAVALASASGTPLAHPAPDRASFRGVGDLPGGEFSSVALAISGDGRVLVGHSRTERGDEAFRWVDGVLTRLGGFAGEARVHTVAHAVSYDGSVVVGTGAYGAGTRAFRWHDGRMAALEGPSPAAGFSEAWGVTADGGTVVGQAQLEGAPRAVAWRGGEAAPLGEGALREARAVSAAGTVVAGSGGSSGTEQAFRLAGAHLEALSTPEGRPEGVTAAAVSADGSTVVGTADTVWGREACRWRAGTALGLGGLSDEHEYFSAARGVSADGSVVVGSSEGASGDLEAFVWDEADGMRPLRDVLVRDGLDLKGWTLAEATAVSGDGRTIVGYGRNPEGQTEGWIARLPPRALRRDDARPAAAAFGEFRGEAVGLRDPAGVAVGPDGRIYVADTGNDRVSVHDARGARLRTLDATLGHPRHLARPTAVAVAPDGALLVLDAGNQRVVGYTPSGAPRQAFGGIGRVGPFRDPRGLAVDADRIAVGDTGNDRVLVFDRQGRLLKALGGSGDGPGRFHGPTGLAFDGDGNLYVADTQNHRVQKLGRDGRPLAVMGERGRLPGFLLLPAGLAWHAGELHVVETGHDRVQVFDGAGRFQGAYGASAARPRQGQGRLHAPEALAIAPGGDLAVVCEPVEDRCQILARGGKPAGAATAVPAEREDFGPHLCAAGRLLAVTRPAQDAVDVFDLDAPGQPRRLMTVGRHGSGAGEFIHPSGVALDLPRGRLLAADAENGRVQAFALGSPARFVRAVTLPGEPAALAVDSSGAVYVIDAARSVVLRLDERLALQRVITLPRVGGVRFDPVDLAVDPRNDRLLVLGGRARRVAIVDAAGRPQRGFALPEGASPRGLAVDADGSLWLVGDDSRVRHLDPAGRVIGISGVPGIGPGQLHKPRAVGVDGRGRMIVLDWGNRRAVVLSREGAPLGAFGGGLWSRPAQVLSADAAAPGTMPAFGTPRDERELVVRFEPAPERFPLNETFSLQAQVLDARGRPVGGARLAVDAQMPAHGHGLATPPQVVSNGNGSFAVHGLRLHMAGAWQLRFDVTRGAFTERTAVDLGLPSSGQVPPAAEFDEAELARILRLSPLPAAPALADDAAGAGLGQFLFFDRALSGSGEASCATCHDPGRGFADGQALPAGATGGSRHTPTLWNVAYNRWYFWDGRADSLWAQALEPIESAGELGGSRLQVARRIHDDPGVRRAYERLYGSAPDLSDPRRFPARGGPRAEEAALRRAWEAMAPADQRSVDEVFVNAARAVAAYERRLVSRRSPFDLFVEGLRAGDEARQRALSPLARRGLKVFVGRGECWPCHDGPNFSDGEFHDVGVPPRSGGALADSGRYAGAKRLGLMGSGGETWGQFKTPTLRNVARTAPYMHQGQLETLGQVVEHYSSLRGATFGAHHREALLRPRQLTPDEAAALVAFLESLTDEEIDPALKRPPPAPE